MKILIILSLLLISSSGFSQLDNYLGIYKKNATTTSGMTLKVVLKLNADGTFYCTYYNDQIDYVDDNKGKGNWTVKDSKILFSAKQGKDVNKEYTLDFEGTIAVIEGNKLIFKKSKMYWPSSVSLIKKK